MTDLRPMNTYAGLNVNNMTALLSPPPTMEAINYINNSMISVGKQLGDIGSDFLSRMKTIVTDKLSNNSLLKQKKLLNLVNGHIDENVIIELMDDDTLCTASMYMQRYVMANPELNKLYRDNMCDGFNDTYVGYDDAMPNHFTKEYSSVVDGIFMETETGSKVSVYIENEIPKLNLIDKMSVLNTWKHVEDMLARGLDPSDVDKGEL